MISFKNWGKKGYVWLNTVAYAGLGAVGFAMGAEAAGFQIDWINDKEKRIIALTAIGFKFLEKLTAKKDEPNT
jgi:hypothetical protein